MYQLGINRTFSARHFLIGGDWGAENLEHAHQYRLECMIESPHLNQHGYLVDILQVHASLDKVLEAFIDRTLNECTEFEGLNPSLENFARIIAVKLKFEFDADAVSTLTIKLWEDEDAWASYHQCDL
jgi:6-pyruvoyltetrahydropterin/6-carboxytetrahydropterin synthase